MLYKKYFNVIMTFYLSKHVAINDIYLLVLTVNPLKPTGYVMHHQFNIKQLYVLPTL